MHLARRVRDDVRKTIARIRRRGGRKNRHRARRGQPGLRNGIEALVAADAYDYPYLWSWWGLPIIQLPADIMATQEVIFDAQPDVIVETGVARGGSLIFMASLSSFSAAAKSSASISTSAPITAKPSNVTRWRSASC